MVATMERPAATTEPSAPKTVYTCAEVADLLRISERYVRYLIERGQIGGMRLGRVVRVPASEVQRLLEEARPTAT